MGWRTTIKSEMHVRLRVLTGWRTTIKLAIEGEVRRRGGVLLLLNLGADMDKKVARLFFAFIFQCSNPSSFQFSH